MPLLTLNPQPTVLLAILRETFAVMQILPRPGPFARAMLMVMARIAYGVWCALHRQYPISLTLSTCEQASASRLTP